MYVPAQLISLALSAFADTPKSAILTCPLLFTNKFDGFISR